MYKVTAIVQPLFARERNIYMTLSDLRNWLHPGWMNLWEMMLQMLFWLKAKVLNTQTGFS